MSLKTRAALVLTIGTVLGLGLSLGGHYLQEPAAPASADLTWEQARLLSEVIERVRPLVSRQALPREVRVVDALPRNATGKVLVAELRDAYVRDTRPPD